MTGDESGQIAGMEAVIFGVLIFVFGTLVLANAWGVIDAKMAAAGAAREGARAFVESQAESGEAARAGAVQAARDAFAGYRSAAAVPDVRFTPDPPALARCARVTVEVRHDVAVISLPLIGRSAGTFTVSARHSEIVDPYRSGVPGTDQCPAGIGL
ncbi:MAG TPA: hypothetical protein VFO65_02215 [Acidimicrobiales bacterium]|nr:hypothetical protein [Acidimicrobiales bacterium]